MHCAAAPVILELRGLLNTPGCIMSMIILWAWMWQILTVHQKPSRGSFVHKADFTMAGLDRSVCCWTPRGCPRMPRVMWQM